MVRKESTGLYLANSSYVIIYALFCCIYTVTCNTRTVSAISSCQTLSCVQ